MTASQRVAVFGASGAIGGAIAEWFAARGDDVVAISRSGKGPASPNIRCVSWDGAGALPEIGAPVSAAVWAQGANCTDSIHTFDLEAHQAMYAANVTYIMTSLQALLARDLVAAGGRLCIISSIWQNIARQNKLSYCVTKAALQGLVQSLAIDLGASGYLVNAVLPGALDTPMTRANLSPEQIAKLEGMTPLGTLPALDDVTHLVGYLCSPANTGITGQFVSADKGFSRARIL
ncbi:SDR family NAD(P)-dependent oxidoreductase [Pararobbsia silviterrae]|uniref:SDR family oxidoreductase n=1 Tax=Pararobbsia silviterrae TaxID=1792498 RepID=A0A494YBD9_9BURK|nr:SDR family oxidoreductase [Pararobbsia silviterrae]RKP59070.1 SDR family oxidoreductase [Pararobbsia silviterrae]